MESYKKNIHLAPLGRRIFAAFVDFLMVLGISAALYFGFVFNLCFDKTSYQNNLTTMQNYYVESSLYIQTETYTVTAPENLYDYNSVSELNHVVFGSSDNLYKVDLIDNLYQYHTKNCELFGYNKLSNEVFQNSILKVGTAESNIASFDSEKHQITIIDASKEATTVSFVLSSYEDACQSVHDSAVVTSLDEENNKIMIKALLMIIPTLGSISAIFTLVIPLCSKNRASLGKMWMHLALVSKEGYELKKRYLIPRYLVYTFIELIGGTLSFGALLIVSYTMLLFKKKRRCLHDIVSNSVVIDEKTSFWFTDAVEEDDYYQRHKNEIPEENQ